ncbi:hypothetical protein Clacol_004831 [Clathrus columnatus]|uniref:Uncharacterized protein n=1 Tax=Clathrus columnatus TaxID=1419009 RepID=A0AAV5A7L0_9AGAM|nr:hypothetical protein Clacol_004831 [Clathrus columnatus]
MMCRAWSGCLEVPIEWLGRSDDELLSELYTSHPVSGLLQLLGEEQIKLVPVNSEEQTLRMLNPYDPLPEFIGPIKMPVNLEGEVQMNAFRTFLRCALLMRFPLGVRTNFDWSSASHIAMHIMAFFKNFSGVTNRESIVQGPFRDQSSRNTSDLEFAVMINRYGSRPRDDICGYVHEHSSPSLADQSLYRGFFMQITPTHPALVVGMVEENEVFTPLNKKRILKSLASLTEPSLYFLVNGWRQYCLQNGLSVDEPFPCWLVLFSLVVDPKQVTIIAHYPTSPNLRTFNNSPQFSSLVLDSIEFHTSVEMSVHEEDTWENLPSDTTWIYDRLRLGMALLRILKNSRHILLMWDELRWSSDTLLWEEEYNKRIANIKWRTPNPSESARDLWAETWSEEKRIAYEAEKEDLRLEYEIYFGDEMNRLISTNGSDDANPEVFENLVRKSIERVSLWLEGLSKDSQQPFNLLSKD